MASTIVQFVNFKLQTEQSRLERIASRIPSLFNVRKTMEEAKMLQQLTRVVTAIRSQLSQRQSRIDILEQRLHLSTDKRLTSAHHSLAIAETQINGANPKRLLRLGFSITRINGKAVTSAKQVKAGDLLKTTLTDGEITSLSIK